MEGIVDALLIQRALHRLVEETLVDIAVVRAERGREDLVANIESVDDADGVWTDRGEHLLEARLQHRHVLVVQAGKLQSQRKRMQIIIDMSGFLLSQHPGGTETLK